MNQHLNFSRRKFLTLTSLGLGLGTSELFASNKPKIPDDKTYKVFDCHIHAPAEQGERFQWYKVTQNFEDFVSYLDKTGVQRAILNSQRSYLQEPAEFIAGNREIARYVDKYKGRFLGACIVNPLFIEESLREIEDCRDKLGFIWVGELCNYMVPYKYTIREFEMLVDHVVKLNMILALHTNVEELEFIAEKFPQATIVFAHFGDNKTNIFKRIDTVAKNPNFYFDTSGGNIDRVGILEYAIKTIGPDRVLYGSDFTINDPAAVIGRVKSSLLSEEQKRKVFSENVESLLKKFHVKI
jgi:uncharacterized protein